MITYERLYKRAMFKQAENGGGMLDGIVNAGGQLWGMYAAYLVGSALLSGTAIGYGVAKASSPSAQDKATIRKAYDNERLSADLGYVRERLRDEAIQQAMLQNKNVRSIRVFN